MQPAELSGREPDSFYPTYPTPLAHESQAAKATASACPAESVSPSPEPTIPLAPCRPPGPTQVLLHSLHPDSRERVPKPFPLTAALPQHSRKRLPAARQSPDRSLHFPCCQPELRPPQPAWSVPALY